ncbi:hypothetical protein JCM3765_006407 [Sporobolomyces pararoseus]
MATTTKGSITPRQVYLPAPSTIRGQSTKLYSTPDGKSIAYGAGRTAVIRSIDPTSSSSSRPLLFSHPSPITVVKPLSSYYCASGDSSGNLKVWDTTGNYSIKFESKPLQKINDISVDGEGKRLVVGGEGKSGWAASFNLDTGGSSVGEISGHSKQVNSVAIRPTRPFKAVTGSDDFSTCFLPGVPFKFESSSRRHTRFVQSLDYSPDGSLYCSAGSDGQVLLYDGLTGQEKGALIDETASGKVAHEKGVFAASFSRDSKFIATSSADKTCKLWDVEAKKVVMKWNFEGDDLQKQQVGNTFVGDYLVSLSFSGDLNVLDPKSSTPSPIRVIQGHQNPLTALAVSSSNGTFITGDSSGMIVSTDSKTGEMKPVEGSGHSGQIVDIVRIGGGGGDEFVSTAFDDTIKQLSTESFTGTSLPTGTQPRAIAVSNLDSSIYLLTSNSLEILSSPKLEKLYSLPLNFTPLCIASSPQENLIAIGGDDSSLTIHKVSNPKLPVRLQAILLRSSITSVAFSPSLDNNGLVAVGLSTGSIPLYNTKGELVSTRWSGAARIQALRWNKEGTHVAAAGLDESISIFSVKRPGTVISLPNVHKGGVKTLEWLGSNQLVSAGQDGIIRTFDVQL